MAEQDKIAAELDKLAKEIEAEKAELKTLKENSTDYMTRLKGIFEKQANLQAQKEFQKQNMELKDQKWTEGIYKDIIRITADVAKQKGLELVFEESEVDLEGASVNEVMLTIRTHKLLYSDGCADITNDVIAKLDTAEDEKPKTQTDQQKTDSKN